MVNEFDSVVYMNHLDRAHFSEKRLSQTLVNTSVSVYWTFEIYPISTYINRGTNKVGAL